MDGRGRAFFTSAGFDPKAHDPHSPDYWLAYWITAFTEVISHVDRCHILVQDDLRAAPIQTMKALCPRLDLATAEVDFSTYFLRTPDTFDPDMFTPELLDQADRLYAKLIQLSLGA